MKLKKLLIPAIILTLVGFAAKICDTVFNVNGSGFFLSSAACNIITACAFALLFVIAFVMSVMDRKKQFVSEPAKNTVCGVFGFIASVMLIGGGVVQLLQWNGVNIVENLLAVAAGFVLLYESCISFTGSNGMKKIPVAALIVPIWSCVRFVSLFVDYTTKSLRAVELFDIVEVAFLMLFLYYQSMYFAGVNNKLAVRRVPVYGSVFIMLGLITCTDLFIKMFTGSGVVSNVDTQIVQPTLTNIMTLVGDLALCVYAFFLIRDMLNRAEKSLSGTIIDNAKTEPEAKAETKTEPETGSESQPRESSFAPEQSEANSANTGAAACRREQGSGVTLAEPETKTEPETNIEDILPKVEEPAKATADSGDGAYDELMEMLDNMEK